MVFGFFKQKYIALNAEMVPIKERRDLISERRKKVSERKFSDRRLLTADCRLSTDVSPSSPLILQYIPNCIQGINSYFIIPAEILK